MPTNSRVACRPRHLLSCLLILLALCSAPARADHKDIEAALKPEFTNKTFFLRHFYANEKLHFDKDGFLLGKAARGYFSSDSVVQIAELSVNDKAVVLKGKRFVFLFNEKAGRFDKVNTYHSLQLTVELDPASQDAAQLKTLILSNILASDVMQVAADIPDYWQCWAFGTIERRPDGNWKCSSGVVKQDIGAQLADIELMDSQPFTASDGTLVYKIGGDVRSPKLKSPPTIYDAVERASKIGVRGSVVLSVIVTERGEVGPIAILRPVGAGVDENLIESIRATSRFNPATRNGTPVAVRIQFEVLVELPASPGSVTHISPRINK